MQVAPDIIAEYTRQTGDQNKDSIKKNGLFTAPAKVVNASCDQVLKYSDDRRKAGKGHKQEK